MGFVGVYSAVYDYQPQGEGELEIREGDLLYILEKSAEDDWWKAKKKAEQEDEDEPEGLVPNNYVEEVSIPDCSQGPGGNVPLLSLCLHGLGSVLFAAAALGPLA